MVEWPTERNFSKDTSPPFGDWERLLSTFEIVEEVGPRFDTGKLLQRLEDGLFDGVRLKSVVNSYPLNWLDGRGRVKSEILRKIPFDSRNALDVVRDFKNLKATLAGLSPTSQLTVSLSDEDLIGRGLVFLHNVPSNEYVTRKPTFYYYAHVSSDWAKFFVELKRIDAIITKLMLRCLCEGRAICVRNDSSGSALLMPSYWKAMPTSRGTSKVQFIITCDLPEAWRFKNMKTLERSDRELKANAIRWLYMEYRRPNRSEDLLNKDAVMNALETGFGMKTPKVRNEVWDEAPIPNWRQGGRPINT